MWRFLFLVFFVGLAACSNVLTSESLLDPSNPDEGAYGISYNLPRGRIGFRVLAQAESARILVCVTAPQPVADPQQQYLLSFRNSPFSADQYTVKRSDLTGSLEEINVRTQDQTDQFAINLARSAGALSSLTRQAALATDCADTTLFELANLDFDPAYDDEVDLALLQINTVVMNYVDARLWECGKLKDKPADAGGIAYQPQACREYERIYSKYANSKNPVRVAWRRPNVPAPRVKPDCSVGFCYRHTLPHTMHLSIAGSAVYSHTFQLPNTSPVVSLDLTRAIAITKTTKITFGRLGEISQIDVKKGRGDPTTGVVEDGAEAVELAKVPMDVVNAYFQSLNASLGYISSAFQSEATAVSNETALINNEVALTNARKEQIESLKKQGSDEGTVKYVLAASNAVQPQSLASKGPTKTASSQPPETSEKPDAEKPEEKDENAPGKGDEIKP